MKKKKTLVSISCRWWKQFVCEIRRTLTAFHWVFKVHRVWRWVKEVVMNFYSRTFFVSLLPWQRALKSPTVLRFTRSRHQSLTEGAGTSQRRSSGAKRTACSAASLRCWTCEFINVTRRIGITGSSGSRSAPRALPLFPKLRGKWEGWADGNKGSVKITKFTCWGIKILSYLKSILSRYLHLESSSYSDARIRFEFSRRKNAMGQKMRTWSLKIWE